MLDIQLGRRNLSPIQRIAITEKYRPIYEKQARENQSKAGKNYGIGNEKLSQNSSKAISPNEKIDVRAKLAETACKLRLNGISIPHARNGYSIFSGTKYY